MSNTRRVTTSAVLVLSLATSAPPGAAALGVASAATASPAVYSRQDKQLVQLQSAASQPARVYSRQEKSLLPSKPGSTAAPATAGKVSSPQPVVRSETPKSDFHWGDAGIGAAGGVALAMLCVGGALAVAQRRPRRGRHTTSPS